jgi:hypothetical protein
MTTEISIMVARWFEHPRSNLPADHDTPIAWAEHNRRATSLHQVLDDDPEWRVTDWGDTDDQRRTHEDIFVDIVHWVGEARPALEVIGSWAGLTIAGTVLANAVDSAAVNPLKRLIGKLARKQGKGELARFVVKLPNGARIFVDPWGHSKVHIATVADGGQTRVTVTIEAIAPAEQT